MKNGGALETLNASSRSVSPLLSKSSSAHHPRKHMHHRRLHSRFDQENAPPPDPNVQIDPPVSPSLQKKPSSRKMQPTVANAGTDCMEKPSPSTSDSSVKVVVRIRPVNSTEGEANRIVRKVSPDSLSVGSQTFNFDSVVGPGSTQEDVFQLVGAPLVKDSLAGFNTSILCYGETGSGKTYTMWGPLSAMLEERSASNCQGITPRIFHMLFSEIQKMQECAEETQINFQCRCSFLEIYNEQISDLLDPIQRNLQIKDDAKNGFYVENLSEEYVTNIEDVTQILVKGLSNRRVGATSVNSKSSRSHTVLTCVIESWCKGTSSKAFSNSRTSRISLVDLAGVERNIPDDASGRYKREGRHIKKSLSKLGKLVNSLAEVKQSGENQKNLHHDSCLTHLLRESLGGNAKATFICAVSPVDRCRAGTLSTLRFGQQAKYIENKAVINEITEDYVNDLSDQIRQLKEELIREKTHGGKPVGAMDGYFRRHNVRGSLNLLRASLNRSLILPQIESDPEEEEYKYEDDVEELYTQINNLHSSSKETMDSKCSSTDGSFSTDKTIGRDSPKGDLVQIDVPESDISETLEDQFHDASSSLSLSISPCQESFAFQEPTMSTSPKINSNMKKSVANLSDLSAPGNHASEDLDLNSEQVPVRRSDHVRSSLQSNKLSPTASLAASLHRGLQIIDYHQRRSSLSKNSSVGFSFDYLKSKPFQSVDKNDAAMQTLPDESLSLTGSISPFICASCKQADGTSKMQVVAVSDAGKPKDYEKDSAEAIKRALELEKICAEQEATIKQLNNQVEQYKEELKPKTMVEQNHDVSVEEKTVEMNQLVEDIHENQPEISGDENKQKVLEFEGKQEVISFDMSERKALLEEIQNLRSQLQSYSDNSNKEDLLDHINRSDSSDKIAEEFEKARWKWTESESKWICLTEELRCDLESNRRLAEKKDIELASEKQCSAELDDALQRAILGHGRMVEHYVELQEKYTNLLDQHRKVMGGIAQVKKAALKAGKKSTGSAFAQALSAELSTLRAEREKERAFLKEQNRVLKIQLRDTAEAVHAAGELLVKLREAEEAASIAEDKYAMSQQETEKLRKQMEKMKNKHAMEMITMKHYMAESRLPESALQPLFKHEADRGEDTGAPVPYDCQSWRAAFAPSYQ